MASLIAELKEQYSRKLPFVAYRKPGEEVLTAILQGDSELHGLREYTESGFVFAPFIPSEPRILLLPDKVLRMRYPAEPGIQIDRSGVPEVRADEKKRYLKLAGAARELISNGGCSKIVVSRKQEAPLSSTPLAAFESLLKMYPTEFCYLWYHPGVGIWLGASPETFLRLEDGIFSTMSLAGTMASTDKTETPKWGAKELEEQALVTHFIRDALKSYVSSLHVSDPLTVQAGAMLHLQSRISGIAGSCSLADFIRCLHPTPAVCGIPRAEAMRFILENEHYDRAYYTGFLGEINMQNGEATPGSEQACLFVNLRCMSLSSGLAEIYVGGGITAASIPEEEWKETRHKAATMFGVLLNSAD